MAYNQITIDLCRLQSNISCPEHAIFAHCGLGKSELLLLSAKSPVLCISAVLIKKITHLADMYCTYIVNHLFWIGIGIGIGIGIRPLFVFCYQYGYCWIYHVALLPQQHHIEDLGKLNRSNQDVLKRWWSKIQLKSKLFSFLLNVFND